MLNQKFHQICSQLISRSQCKYNSRLTDWMPIYTLYDRLSNVFNAIGMFHCLNVLITTVKNTSKKHNKTHRKSEIQRNRNNDNRKKKKKTSSAVYSRGSILNKCDFNDLHWPIVDCVPTITYR